MGAVRTSEGAVGESVVAWLGGVLAVDVVEGDHLHLGVERGLLVKNLVPGDPQLVLGDQSLQERGACGGGASCRHTLPRTVCLDEDDPWPCLLYTSDAA